MIIKDKEIPLLEAVVNLSNEIGVQRITLEKIAAAASVSFGKVHYYLGKGQDLIVGKTIQYVGSHSQKYIGQYILEHVDENPLYNYVDSHFNWVQQFPKHAKFWSYFYYLCSTDTSLSSINAQYIDIARKRVEGLVKQAIGSGYYQDVTDIGPKSVSIHSLIVGTLIMSIHNACEYSLEVFRQLTRDSIDAILKRDCSV